MAGEIPLVELEVTDSDVDSVLECLRSGWLTMGPRAQALEEAIAEMVGTEHAIVVSSGTAALHLACRSLGLGQGDEVIVPAFTFAATAHAPRYGEAEVVLCDSVSPFDPNLDPVAVESLIGPRTEAVVAVHMWGYPAAVEELRELCDRHGLALIEDCAQAICARLGTGGQVGSVGELGCFSFFSKNQLAVGEGGAVTTDDDALAATVRSLRSHAMSSVTWERHRGHGLGYDVTDVGFNYRIDEPRAALALSRFERLGADIEARREVARGYRERLAGREGLEIPFSEEQVERSSHFSFAVLARDHQDRDRVRSELRERGIQTTYYPALHTLSEYSDRGSAEALPDATAIGERHLVLPIHHLLGPERVEQVAAELAEAAARG
jgi:dTDP-4-amino-4,6-dideoxygalactose transaminase